MCPIKAGCWQCKTINVNLWASCYKCATGSCNFNELVCTYEVYFILNTRIYTPNKKEHLQKFRPVRFHHKGLA